MGWIRILRVGGVLAVGLFPAACGWVEVGSGPRLASAPPTSDSRFVNASAVIVGRGDTLYAISKRHNVPMRAIIEANSLTPPYVLQVGQRIVLPRGRHHVVQRGDTLSLIAQHYDVDMYALARTNGLKSPYVIHPGQKLVLPGKSYLPPIQTTTATQKVASKAAPKTTRLPPPPPASGRGFVWPLRGQVISTFGGKDKGLRNDGINIAAPRGAPVRAALNGVVAYAGNELRGFGNLLLVKHDNGWITAYAHNDELLVKRGATVTRGQAIARVGSTGSVTRPQLHFEVRKGKRPVDPVRYLPKVTAGIDLLGGAYAKER